MFVVLIVDYKDINIHKGFQEQLRSSDILCAWSEAFQGMMTHNFCEGSSHSVVIRGFSVKGVECFLRFLYSGVVEASLATTLEVGAIADKYGVDDLRKLCIEYVTEQLSSENVFELFEESDRLQLQDIRETCIKRLHSELTSGNACELTLYAERHRLVDLREASGQITAS